MLLFDSAGPPGGLPPASAVLAGVSPGTVPAMHPNTLPTGRPWDGSPRTAPPRRPLRVAATSPSRLLRAGQNGRCRHCGNRIDLYQRTDQRPIALHPAELTAAHVPASCRWHLSSGIAHPHGDGSAWCRIPHAVLCPQPHPHLPDQPAPRGAPPPTRRPHPPPDRHRRLHPCPAPKRQRTAATPTAPDRPVVQMLLGRYLAERPVEGHPLRGPDPPPPPLPHPGPRPHHPPGTWRLLPLGPQRGQLALPDTLMAVYDLSHLPYAEQLRWRTQHCPAHAAAPGAADLALAGWQPFDPLLHAAHIHTRLPHTRRPTAAEGVTMPHHALEILLTRPLCPGRTPPTPPACCRSRPTTTPPVSWPSYPPKPPAGAAHRLRHRLGARLPDRRDHHALPGRRRQVLLNVAFPPAAHAALQPLPPSDGAEPGTLRELALHRALARARRRGDRPPRPRSAAPAHPHHGRTPPGRRRTRPDPHPRSSPAHEPDRRTDGRSRRLPRRRAPRPAGRRRHRQNHHPDPARPHHHTPRPLPRLQPGHRPGRTHPLPRHRHLQDRPRPRLRRRRPPLHPPPERTPPPGLADRPGPRHHQAIRIGERDLSQRALSNATLRTVARFCHTADEAITRHHVPRLRGLEDNDLHTQLAAHIVPFARKAWTDLQHPDDGAVRFDHDHYLKIWALTQPRIDADFLLLDEAQDTNPVVEQIFLHQRDHAQLVMVGDSAQAIYDWRGAKDVMTGFDGTQLTLSQSFRFGPHLAEEANRWLAIADAPSA